MAFLVCKWSTSIHVTAFQHHVMARIHYHLFRNLSLNTIEKAMYHAKKAISLNRNNYCYWNTLGIIAEGNQNHLEKSILVNI